MRPQRDRTGWLGVRGAGKGNQGCHESAIVRYVIFKHVPDASLFGFLASRGILKRRFDRRVSQTKQIPRLPF
jgi:hypothetical protein